MQQNTKQNAKQTVVHTTKDNEDTAKKEEEPEESELIFRCNLSIARCET